MKSLLEFLRLRSLPGVCQKRQIRGWDGSAGTFEVNVCLQSTQDSSRLVYLLLPPSQRLVLSSEERPSLCRTLVAWHSLWRLVQSVCLSVGTHTGKRSTLLVLAGESDWGLAPAAGFVVRRRLAGCMHVGGSNKKAKLMSVGERQGRV